MRGNHSLECVPANVLLNKAKKVNYVKKY